MGEDKGGRSFGFAPRGGPAERKGGPGSAARSGPVHAKPRRPGARPVPVPTSRRSPWVWLSVGLLLGAGVTLLTSSFWLPKTGDQPLVGDPLAGVEAEDRSPAADNLVPTSGNASDAKSVAEAVEAAGDETVSGGTTASVPQARPAPASADDIEILLSEHQDDSFVIAPKPADEPDAARSDDVPRGEPAAGAATPASLEPTEALAALTGTGERPIEADADAPSPESSPPDGNDIAARTENAESAPDIAENSAAETATETGDDRADLPPRIRQALLEAESARENGSDAGALYRVQLAAVDDEAAARVFWREVNDRLPGVFDNVEPIFNRREVDERLFYQVWVGTFADLSVASGYCGWLKEQGQDCFVTQIDKL